MLCLTTSTVMAQNSQGSRRQRQGNAQSDTRQRQGSFDPAQFQQRIVERYRDRLEISDDAEWKAIQPLIQKVIEARMSMGAGARGTFSRGGRSGGEANQNDRGQRRALTSSNPAVEQLQRAIDSKAPPAEVRTALARYFQYRKEKQADLERAQTALRNVLSARQEAIATLSGLL